MNYFEMSDYELQSHLHEERKWGGLARYEINQIESEMKRRGQKQENEYWRNVFSCEHAFHGRKY